jgi:hypothetical protein
MGLFDNGLKFSVPGILAGLGVALAAPVVLPAVAAASRPLAKSLIRGYLVLADTVKEVAAETGEQISDMVAEAKAEHGKKTAAAAAPQKKAKT